MRRALPVIDMRLVPCAFCVLLTVGASALAVAQAPHVEPPGPPLALVPREPPVTVPTATSRNLELLIPLPQTPAPVEAPAQVAAAPLPPLTQSASAERAR